MPQAQPIGSIHMKTLLSALAIVALIASPVFAKDTSAAKRDAMIARANQQAVDDAAKGKDPAHVADKLATKIDHANTWYAKDVLKP